MIKETHESNTSYGGIHKQRMRDKEQLVHYHFGIWLDPQKNYSSITREILSIVLCISKFQDDLINQKFLLRIDYKSAKDLYKRMLRIYFQNKSLPDGKQFYLLLVSTLNSSNDRTIPYQISLTQSFCQERVTKHLLCRSSQ